MTPVWMTHIIDEENIGDMVCCPADYFDLPVEGRIDFRCLLADPLPEQGGIIFGGDGLCTVNTSPFLKDSNASQTGN